MSDVTAAMDHGVEEPQLTLPPGFRFHPTDEEVVSHYLTPKVLDHSFSCLVVADVDLNECEPCDLPGRAKMGEKEWYFFVHKSRKYPTGSRTNRATKIGYWKATGRDKEIYRGKGRAAVLVGMKKTLVFYRGRAPRGVKTPWVMHEYRLDGKLPAHLLRSAKDEWAVCRVINKDLVAKNAPQVVAPASAGGMEPSDSMFFIDDLIDLDGLPPLMDSPFGGAAAADDDFTGASSSTSGAAAPPEPGMGYMVKMEQPPPVPAQETQSQYYFSMPAAPNGAGYSQYQAAGNPQAAIRRDCRRPEAPSSSSTPTQLGALLGGEAGMPSLMPSTSRQPSYQDLDELFSEPLMDYSNLWNI